MLFIICKYTKVLSINKTFILNFSLKVLFNLVLTIFLWLFLAYLQYILYFRRAFYKNEKNIKQINDLLL